MAGQVINFPGGSMGFALVPGPPEIDQPLYSFEVEDEIDYHDPNEVATALLAIPGMHRIGSSDPLSGEWAARWRDGDRYLDFDMRWMEPEDGRRVWGGSQLEGWATEADLLRIWAALSERFEGVWLHGPDCRLYTPEGFAQRELAEPGAAPDRGRI
jgi:hypothetical protein